jgi:hypothetical protein
MDTKLPTQTFLPQLLAVIFCPGQLLANTHNEETANVNLLIIMPNVPSPRHGTAQATGGKDGLQMRVYCVPNRDQRTTHITCSMQYKFRWVYWNVVPNGKLHKEICNSEYQKSA